MKENWFERMGYLDTIFAIVMGAIFLVISWVGSFLFPYMAILGAICVIVGLFRATLWGTL